MAKSADTEVFEQIGDLARRNNWSGLSEVLTSAPQNQARRKAMDVMLAGKSPEAYELLADVAAGPEVGLNEEILTRLRDIPGEDTLRALARVLSCENTLRRALVVSHFAKRLEPAALPMLLRGARDPSNAVSRIGERALMSRGAGESQATRGAAARVDRGDCVVRAVRVRPGARGPRLSGRGPRGGGSSAWRRGGADAVTTLMALVVDPEPMLARAAWDGLRAVKDLPATFLLPFLGERRDEIRKQGVELFARFCGTDAAPILAGLLRDKAATVREATVRAMHQLQREACIPSIVKLVKDPGLCVRRAVVEILARFPQAADDLVGIALREEGSSASARWGRSPATASSSRSSRYSSSTTSIITRRS